MTNCIDLLKEHIERYNEKNSTDFSFNKIIPDEVLFVEVVTSERQDTIFDFSVKFGIKEAKLSVEGYL